MISAVAPRHLPKHAITMVLAALLLFASGCKSFDQTRWNKPLTKEELAKTHIGPPPVNYREKIKVVVSPAVLDPKTTIYEFEPPRASKVWRGIIRGGYRDYWLVNFRVNTKKPDGTFTGPMPCEAIFDEKGKLLVNEDLWKESLKTAMRHGRH